MFATRRKPARKLALNVDTLEGRQLLSTLTFQKITMTAVAPADIKKMAPVMLSFGGGGVGQHIGVTADSIQGSHIGMTAAVQGGHPGTGVVSFDLNPQPLPPGYVHEPKNWW